MNKTFLALLVSLCFISFSHIRADVGIPPGEVETFGTASAVYRDGGLLLKIDNPYNDPAVRLLPPGGADFWDFSEGTSFAVDVENLSPGKQARFLIILRTPVKGKKGTFTAGIALNPGETRTLRFRLPHQWLYAAPQGVPGLCTIDTARITAIDFALHGWFERIEPGLVNCRLSNFRLEGKLTPTEHASPAHMENLFPFIDLYGQYIHADWPEKIHSDADLRAAFEQEKQELDASIRPVEWNRFGGWKNGPQLEATGSFRVEKYQGKWFLVDPAGNLFFSQGMNVLIKHTDPVKLDGHDQWFVPEIKDHTFQSGTSTYWQPTDRSLQIKYGKMNYTKEFYETLAKRLEHWGFNTIGDWGHPDLILQKKMPYTLELTDFDRTMPKLGPKFYDVYDPIYQWKMKNLIELASKRNAAVRDSLTDPLCIGYFIDNELEFGNRGSFSFARHVMTAPAEQAAKKAFVAELENRYGTINTLNATWDTAYTDWDAVLESKAVPINEAFRADMERFFTQTVELYFQLCRDAVKSAMPNRLYLGCRFLGHDATHPILAELCGRYADVFSVNLYRHTPGNFQIDGMPDVPVMIGEFHFSSSLPGRGRFSPDIVAGSDETERAVSYLRYMQGALIHPNIVGAHWFQLRDQPLTGRSDGEGYQIGFVDIADTPYLEMTRTSREIGENMYRYRLNGKYANSMKQKDKE